MLKSLSPIDVALIKKIGGNGSSYTLPVATETTLGGVKPVTKTDAMTQAVGADEAGALWTAAGGADRWELIDELTVEEEIQKIVFNGFSLKKCFIHAEFIGTATNTDGTGVNGTLGVNGTGYFHTTVMSQGEGKTRYVVSYLEVCGGVKCHSTSANNNNWHQSTDFKFGAIGDGSPISEITFGHMNKNRFGVGTTIQIYGVRT